MKKMRCAIVGTGVISKLHVQAISDHPEAELVAICDIDLQKAEEWVREFAPKASAYSNHKEMFEKEDIDIASICVPSGLHADVAISAAEAGIHVLCEKPLDIRRDKMAQMIETCRNHNVKLGCVYQRRTLSSAILTRQAIQEGKLGKLVLGDAYLKYYRSPEYFQSAGWRGTWELDGGGALMNQGVHGIDLIQWMVGDIESVFAYAAPLVRDIEVEDTAVVVVKYKNDAFGVIQGTTSVYPGQETRFEIHGEKGSIIFGDSGIKQWKFLESDEPIPQTEKEDKGHYLFVDDMIKAVRENREPLVSGEEARKAVDVILAIYESVKTGKEIKINH
ncbi:Gfo/Idh/MocA family oxidoreductase [Lederbergia sp. NSJ-179]|uniref:Gfo/Idh/MocA family protein n=1 Tax=Lederbergia sp. NSJ-179 TaxID=2931402 RepID=UPI001FD2026C|nr:Gfo/Idh/MocA family oxidoreductase [Lederbergia sp. NSJ-179]MCJ7841227.1 Gfo/Idh/MocA family oxidoreductase [Lederbergia sp. NSJ-179]